MFLDVRLIAGVSALAGLVILHLASRKGPEENRGIGLSRGMAFVLAGLLLVVLPLVAWGASFHGASANHPQRVSPASVLGLAGYLDAAFLWMIWNICAYGYRPPIPGENRWDGNWGESYSPDLKKRLLDPVFERLESENGIGDLVVDIGSGAQPVSKFLPARPGRKFILLDIAAKGRVAGDSRSIFAWPVEGVLRSRSLERPAKRWCALVDSWGRTGGGGGAGNGDDVDLFGYLELCRFSPGDRRCCEFFETGRADHHRESADAGDT